MAEKVQRQSWSAERRSLQREYDRIYKEAKRRERGVLERKCNRRSVVDKPEQVFLPGAPLLAELDRCNGELSMIAMRAGVSERQILRYRIGESAYVRLDVADRLAVAMGIPLELIYAGHELIAHPNGSDG